MEEMAITQAKMEEMTITHVEDDDDDWDESTCFQGPIGNPVDFQRDLQSDPPAKQDLKVKEKLADTPKNEDKKLLRQKWTTFVKAICEKRTNFIVRMNDADSAAWAVKNLTDRKSVV
jgi:hypothetical protein